MAWYLDMSIVAGVLTAYWVFAVTLARIAIWLQDRQRVDVGDGPVPLQWSPELNGLERVRGGQRIIVTQTLFDAKITIGPAEDVSGYEHEWMYPRMVDAYIAATVWDLDTEPEPPGDWVCTTFGVPRGQFRRRRPNGEVWVDDGS